MGGKHLQRLLLRGRPARRPAASSTGSLGGGSGGSTPSAGTIKPFTRASLERLETRTAEARKHFGVLPRRSARLQDGAVLPNKFSPFPHHMYGRPLEEFDQFIFEEVSDSPRWRPGTDDHAVVWNAVFSGWWK